MPDSFQSQPDGPSSHDDRALDSLLSGDTSDIAASLRPVADTLNALRAAPSARELRGEAAARAQFRALRQAEFTGAAEPRTLDLPVVPTQRHRSAPVRAVRRRPGWTRLAGLVTAAAVLVLAIAITYTGNLPGGLQHIAHDTIAAPPGRSAPRAATNGMQATSARPVSPSTAASPASVPAPSVPSPVSPGDQGKKALCDQFWSDLIHAQPGRVSWQTPRYRQLVAAAHGAQNVFGYCYPVWDPKFGPQYQRLSSYPPFFPRQWGSQGAQGNGQDQHGQQGQGQQHPDGQQGPGQNQDQQGSPSPSASSSSGPPTGPPASSPAGNQGQNSSGGQN